jgi:hypothetical protein
MPAGMGHVIHHPHRADRGEALGDLADLRATRNPRFRKKVALLSGTITAGSLAAGGASPARSSPVMATTSRNTRAACRQPVIWGRAMAPPSRGQRERSGGMVVRSQTCQGFCCFAVHSSPLHQAAVPWASMRSGVRRKGYATDCQSASDSSALSPTLQAEPACGGAGLPATRRPVVTATGRARWRLRVETAHLGASMDR